MKVIIIDGIVSPEEMVPLLFSVGIPLFGTLFIFLAVGFAYSRYYVRTKIEAASARVLEAHPELAQSTEDFRVYARKVACELGWDRVSFTFS